jgi:hypothetical protein
MKTLLFFSFLVGLVCGATAQDNLIPNPSFEIGDCETDYDTPFFHGAACWYNVNIATPDWFGTFSDNNCGLTNIYNPVALEIGEWQYPVDGEYMTGLYSAILGSETREYIQCKLLDSLIEGHIYCFSMEVSLNNVSNYASDAMGAHFSTDSIYNFDAWSWLGLTPQVQSPSGIPMTDTVGWTVIQGEFTASGGEQFVTIGNHLNDDETNIVLVNGPKNWNVAYYYVDNLNLIDCTPTGISEVELDHILIYPNPTQNWIVIQGDELEEIGLHDSKGKLLEVLKVDSNRFQFNLAERPNGIYLLKVRSASRSYIRKIIKE